MGNIIQNTTQYSLDSLTLFVSLDQKGEANGTLYEDAGDGFQYKKGDYLLSGYHAVQTGTTVEVTVKAIDGNLKPTNRNYKICVVTDKGTFESKWTKGSSISVEVKE